MVSKLPREPPLAAPSTKGQILIIEDEAPLRRFVGIALSADGYVVREAATASEGLDSMLHATPEVVLLDLGLPDLDGITVIQRIRARGDRAPILVMSARHGRESKIEALDEGADEYLLKPFAVPVLLARLRAVLRPPLAPDDSADAVVTVAPDLTIDLGGGIATRAGADVRLSSIELAIIRILLRRPGVIVPNRRLLEELANGGTRIGADALRLRVMQLRHKIELNPAAPRHLRTDVGVGYRMFIDTRGAS